MSTEQSNEPGIGKATPKGQNEGTVNGPRYYKKGSIADIASRVREFDMVVNSLPEKNGHDSQAYIMHTALGFYRRQMVDRIVELINIGPNFARPDYESDEEAFNSFADELKELVHRAEVTAQTMELLGGLTMAEYQTLYLELSDHLPEESASSEPEK